MDKLWSLGKKASIAGALLVVTPLLLPILLPCLCLAVIGGAVVAVPVASAAMGFLAVKKVCGQSFLSSSQDQDCYKKLDQLQHDRQQQQQQQHEEQDVCCELAPEGALLCSSDESEIIPVSQEALCESIHDKAAPELVEYCDLVDWNDSVSGPLPPHPPAVSAACVCDTDVSAEVAPEACAKTGSPQVVHTSVQDGGASGRANGVVKAGDASAVCAEEQDMESGKLAQSGELGHVAEQVEKNAGPAADLGVPSMSENNDAAAPAEKGKGAPSADSKPDGPKEVETDSESSSASADSESSSDSNQDVPKGENGSSISGGAAHGGAISKLDYNPGAPVHLEAEHEAAAGGPVEGEDKQRTAANKPEAAGRLGADKDHEAAGGDKLRTAANRPEAPGRSKVDKEHEAGAAPDKQTNYKVQKATTGPLEGDKQRTEANRSSNGERSTKPGEANPDDEPRSSMEEYASVVEDFPEENVSSSEDEASRSFDQRTSEKSLLREIILVQRVVGYKDDLRESPAHEVARLYDFLGMEVPLGYGNTSDASKLLESLDLLKAIVGVK